ncbi:MAG: hypothetical protein PWP46_490 [Fusobacteriaceae bacterium]|jgi:uncharacterized protein (TIGR02680 family)|nr:hypothetical protein [Fusobacteriales bacterium]MDN5303611.1 hypothetical protein [Fusobacteriaceae bacterium]
MSKWIINKYGFVNFWLFDDEQLTTFKGNLLLNGENGSGKSVTLQSFIPLILDGNTNSNRLSTEGDMSRKIDYYILYGNKEENISYLYAEFLKENEGKKEYITFGIGFKIRQGQSNPQKWYFSLKDIRIGKDIKLYKQEKGYKYIFTKNELKKNLEKKAFEKYKIFSTREEYKNEVNNVLFGFKNIDEFEETLDLILELRKPSLKDSSGFDPKFIYDILNKSLKPLPENELLNMSESLENIEKISIDLNTIEEQNEALIKIGEKYKLYNERVLKERLDNYLEVYHELKRIISELENSKYELKRAYETIRKGKEQIEKLNFERSIKNSKIEELNSNKEFADIQNNYEIVKRKILELKAEKEKLEQQLLKYKKIINETEQNYKFKEKEKQEKQDKLKNIIDELIENSKKINFETIFDFKDFLNEEKNMQLSILETEFKEFEEKLINIIELTKENERKNIKLKDIVSYRTEFEEELFQNKQEYKKILLEITQNKEKLINKIEELNNENEYFYLMKNNIDDVEEFLLENEEKFQKNKIQNYLMNIKNINQNKIMKEIYDIENDIQDLVTEKEKIEIEKNILENKKDIELEISEEYKNERKKLNQNEYIEFYKAVKFKENVPDRIKNLIEKSLYDSGILGALLTTKNTNEIYDKFLISKEEQAENLSKYLEAESNIFDKKIIEKFLKSISLNKEAENYITIDGEYKIGIIKGNVLKNYESKYIGIETRKKLREIKIRKLEEKIKEIEKDLTILNIKKDEILEKKELLVLEYNKINDLIENINIERLEEKIQQNIFNTKNIKQNIEKLKKEEENIELEIQEINKKINNILVLYRIKILDYSLIEKNLNEFKNNFTQLKSEYNILKNIIENYKFLEKSLENQNEIYNETLTSINKIKIELKETEEKKENYRKKLENEEFKSFRIEIEELYKRVNVDIPKLLDEIKTKIIRREERIKELNNKIKDYEENKIKYEKLYDIQNYLLEIELKNDYLELNEEFNEIKDKKRLRDRLRKKLQNSIDKNDAFNELSLVLNQQNRKLLNYHLELKNYEYDYSKIYNEIENNRVNRRVVLTGIINGKKVEFGLILKENTEHLEATKDILNEEERKFFEEFLFNEIGRGINKRVKESREWVKKIDEIMNFTPTSSGKKYKLKWEAKTIDKIDDLKADLIVNILGNKYSKDTDKIKRYFKERINQLKNENIEKALKKSNYEIIKEILDYRTWYEFRLIVVEPGGKEYTLTKKRLNSYSGGEKVMAVYIPLFSALYARFVNARKDGLKIVAMDEAFSVVDDENIEKLFGILENLNINYLLASQKLTGTYKTVKNIAIVHIENPVSKQLVTPENGYISLIKYLWNGVEQSKDLRDATERLF